MFTHVAGREIMFKKTVWRKHCSSFIQLTPSPYLNTPVQDRLRMPNPYTPIFAEQSDRPNALL